MGCNSSLQPIFFEFLLNSLKEEKINDKFA